MKSIYFLALAIPLIAFMGCAQPQQQFQLLPPYRTGIDFANIITEQDTLNILDFEFVYNGAGVAVGDLNGDELPDIYFTGNQVVNKLYLNQGSLKFKDITEISGAQKKANQWSSGINLVDINCDGKLDIYVCNSISDNPEQRRNLLFINTGNNDEKIPLFKEMAAEYGIDDPNHSSHAQFFDYDNDGDLDLFIGVNLIDVQYPNQYFPKLGDGSTETRDILYENLGADSLGHPFFVDVSLKAGIVWAGYSHSTIIHDFNYDGWMDIYVANDYLSNDLLYINNKNKTFSNRIREVMKHQSFSAMGTDLGDINNDGAMDLFATEMQPYYNKRKKLFQNANNYNNYIFNEQYRYEYQFARNTLQLNLGIDPQTGLPLFGDIGMHAGVQETDWSWSPLLADFDNDGFSDLFVANGFPRDVVDHDFGAFRNSFASSLVTREEMYAMIPEIKIPNFFFKNLDGLKFKDVSKDWGIDVPSFSNGAAYADLDNDGDLDLVVNNIDDPAFVFENKGNKNNYCRIKLKGFKNNPDAIGALVKLYTNGMVLTQQVLSGRGYLSQSETILHFGIGNAQSVDSIEVVWPGGNQSLLKNVPAKTLTLIAQDESNVAKSPNQLLVGKTFSIGDPKKFGLGWVHPENDFIDFNFQRTLPHKFSQYGPGIAVGDANGDGKDDLFLGGSARMDATWFIQQESGMFIRQDVSYKFDEVKKEEDLGVLMFDADNDGDNDLYIVRGSAQHEAGSALYQDVLCINNGQGNFRVDTTALPLIRSNGSVVKAVDLDKDGDLDLFRGGRVLPRHYPNPDRSFILINESETKDKPKFRDATTEICPELTEIGMISDALWTDFNNDLQPDLILAGEWMPVTFLQNESGRLKNITRQTGLQNYVGWWNSLAGADFDNDGDIDYAAGNLGLNTYFQCTNSEPLRIYAKDFDNNGSYDPFLSCYWKDSSGVKKEYFYHTRDDMIKQLVLIRTKFQTYGAFGQATVADVFSKEELKGAQILEANHLQTSYIENLSGGKFRLAPMPVEAQLAPVFGMLPYDVDQDGWLDILIVGNDYGMELQQGRADAFSGLLLKNQNGKQFVAERMDRSHFIVPGDARALTRIIIKNQEWILATQNRDSLKLFKATLSETTIMALPNQAASAILQLYNGQQRLVEFYWGSSFLGQETRHLRLDKSIEKVTLLDVKGRQMN